MKTQGCGSGEGDICGRNGCQGIIQIHPVVNCSCHINPPCSACVAPNSFCPKCDWQEADDEQINDYIVNIDKATGVYKKYELRQLDASKIDWHSFSHTNSSMIKRGVYPEGITLEEVRKIVDGTFGGRFNYFGGGKFEFVAYTD